MGRNAERSVVFFALLLYVACFAAFPPRVLSVVDEVYYVRQAQAFARGALKVETRNPFTGEAARVLPSTYPAGTSALQTPFVWLGGWRAAAGASVSALVVTVLVLMRWLERNGKSPLFALVVLGFLPALVLGRIAMSDVPSMAVTTLGMFFFFRSNGDSFVDWLLAGLIAGVSLLFRETNPLLFLPLFVGAMLRRERHWMVIVLGGVLGGLLRPLVAFAITGDPLFFRQTHAGLFGLGDAARNGVLYLIALMILVPGGLAAVLAYRGPRRLEIATTVLAFTGFYVTYGYAAWESGWQKQLVLGPRFLLPMMPLLVLAMAEVFPSAMAHLSSRLPGGIAKTAIAVWVVGVLISIVLAHWMVDRWGRAQQQIVGALYENTPAGAAVIIDPMALSKFANEVYGDRAILSWDDVPPDLVARVLRVYGSVRVALLYRSDADYWRQRNQQGDSYIQRLESRCHLQMVHDSLLTPTDRLRVWNVVNCEANSGR